MPEARHNRLPETLSKGRPALPCKAQASLRFGGRFGGGRSEHAEYLTPAHLGRLVPDVARREVYLCGPPDLVEGVKRSLQILGVPRRRTHSESFEL